MIEQTEQATKKTKQAYLLTSLFNAPFWAIYGMLVFILYKDLHATPFQVAILIALKPSVSLFSIYWSALIHKRPDRLRSNVIGAGILAHFPFFFFPWVESPWFIVFSGALYMLFMRGIKPAWMEILKLNLPNTTRERVFSFGLSLSYAIGVIFPLVFGQLLDSNIQTWRIIFPATALLSLGGLFFQWRIPIPKNLSPLPASKESFKNLLIKPWKDSWTLIKSRPDFARYQLGFMLGGGGLMVMQPALPLFFIDFLNMSYTELAVAISLCKGVGFTLTSRPWANLFGRMSIYRLSSLVTFLACLFPFLLLFAQVHLAWIFFAYVIYGVMQAGSELSWHLSGPVFSGKEDSSPYSSVNVMTAGLRGCIAPCIGSLLCLSSNATIVLIIGGLLCLLASLQLITSHRTAQSQSNSVN